MYIKTICPDCGKKSYVNVTCGLQTVPTGIMLETVEVTDTIKEDDLLQIVSKFVHDLFINGTSTEDIQAIMSRCLGISPQFTDELITKIIIEPKLS